MSANPAPPLLDIHNLMAGYQGTDVLRGISLRLAEGEFVCVIGANTAGKSTLLRCISRIVPRMSGSIRFNGCDLMQYSAHDVPALGIAHVPEGRQVFPEMTVEENLMLGAFTARRADDLEDRLSQVFALFPRLQERQKQFAGTLSGGEQQMVAVGRGLMLQPKLLILDEPSHGLAPKVVQEMRDALVRIHKSGTSILLVEQNVTMAFDIASRGYVLDKGNIALEGPISTLRTDKAVRTAYLGI